MTRRLASAVLIALVAFMTLVPAVRADELTVRKIRPCELTSEWRLIVRRETPTTLRVRYVIATGLPGQTWSVFVSINGRTIVSAERTTDSDGYIRVTRYPNDRDGDDVIKGYANNLFPGTGETCSGGLIYPY
jgi:hypothetical protein